jgi:hypothetical protein
MSSFGCAFRLTFILCSLIVAFFVGLALVLAVATWAGLPELLAAAAGGRGAVLAAGTGVAGSVATLAALVLRRRRGG